MGGKQSTTTRGRAYSHADGPVVAPNSGGAAGGSAGPSTSSGSEHARSRTRSLGNVPPQRLNGHSSALGLSSHSRSARAAAPSGTHDSDSSTPEEVFSVPGRFMHASSLPVHLLALHTGIKCPVCSKFLPPDDIECHLVMCLTKPRISYNEDVLTEDKGECVICLEDLEQGHTIARLPCLCIYHKHCIDEWFKKDRSCPEHPND